MKPSDVAFLKRWEPERKQGRRRFMLITGVLTWAVPMFVVMTFFASPPARFTVATVSIAAVIWFLGGLLFGWLVWFFSERRYRRLTSQQSGAS